MDNKQSDDGGLRELALFAGAGGGVLGGKLLGWRTVCAVERDCYAASVLAQRQNDGCLEPFPIWSDVTTFRGEDWRGRIDVVSGGFPCQDISPANKHRKGIGGKKSKLWDHMRRIISEIQPSRVFVENSSQLVSRGLGLVLSDLNKMGYDAKWCVIGADAVGLPHKRKRIWIYGSNTNGKSGLQKNSKGSTKHDKRNTRIYDAVLDWSQLSESFNEIHNPEIHGGNDGVADRLDRFRAIGNGQVPAVARVAWEILTS